MTDPKLDADAEPHIERVSRYPGVQPFGDDEIQRRLFRGRANEKYELLQLVLAESLVLLFARSGIGKSSLINAGLLEPLRHRGYFPMVVRASGSTGSPLDCLYDGIKVAVDRVGAQGQIEYEPPASDWNRASLWHFFKTFEIWQNDRLLSPVLVIDQFEELFTLHAVEQRKQFIHEIADLVRGTRPRGGGDYLGRKLSDVPPGVKVVLALREDFYANLEELRNRIPSIYKAPFRLKPLSRENARQAILEPAELEDNHFLTPAFCWSDEALDKVLDFLSEQKLGGGKTTVGKEIEPFQLQLICQHVEETVRQRKLKTVTADDLGGAEALKAILSNFYEDSLRKICDQFPGDDGLRERLERLCEYGFITAKGRRLLREESTIKHDDGVEPEILREMVELRLLRKEPRVGDNYYELTHDTLIEPIQLSRQAREELRAREERAVRQAEQRKMRNRLIAVGVAATVVLITLGSLTLWQRAETQRVTEAKQLALSGQRKAEQEAQRAMAAKQQALEEKQASVEVAVKAKLEAGEEGARRIVAEAEATLAGIEPKAVAAQKALAEAIQQAAEAKGQDYEQEAKRLVAEAEAALIKVRRKVETAQKAVYEAKTKVTLAEVKRQVTEDKQAATEIAEGADKSTIGNVERKWVDAEAAVAESERQAGTLKGLNGLPSIRLPVAQSPMMAVESPGVNEKAELKARAKVELAALEFRETEPKVTDAEVAKQYREFLDSSGSELSTAEAQSVKNKASELEQASKAFDDLRRRDKDPSFSVCEAFDYWEAYQPRRVLGPEAQYRDLRLAELTALLQDSAVVTTQKNFITSRGKDDLDQSTRFTFKKDRVYMHVWVNSPRSEVVKLVLKRGDTLTPIWQDKKVAKNPLRGFRMGYHLWTWQGANRVGEYELLLYNAKNKLICRRDFEIVAASQ